MKEQTIPCTKEEIDSIITAAVDSDYFFLLFNLAKKTGRRLGEYYEVKVKDIDFERRIMLTQVLKRRRKVEKEALLDEHLVLLLRRFILKNKLNLDDYLFHKYSYRHIQNRIKFYAEKAGIPHNTTFHNFRHYFVTELFKQGWTYDKIAKLTGHSTAGTLATYDHTVASDLKEDAFEAIKKL